MNRDSTQRLRIDRRLTGRRGWISREDLDKALAELPDTTDKIAPIETSEDDTAAGAGQPG